MIAKLDCSDVIYGNIKAIGVFPVRFYPSLPPYQVLLLYVYRKLNKRSGKGDQKGSEETELKLHIDISSTKILQQISEHNRENNSLLFVNNSILLKIPPTSQPLRKNPAAGSRYKS